MATKLQRKRRHDRRVRHQEVTGEKSRAARRAYARHEEERGQDARRVKKIRAASKRFARSMNEISRKLPPLVTAAQKAGDAMENFGKESRRPYEPPQIVELTGADAEAVKELLDRAGWSAEDGSVDEHEAKHQMYLDMDVKSLRHLVRERGIEAKGLRIMRKADIVHLLTEDDLR